MTINLVQFFLPVEVNWQILTINHVQPIFFRCDGVSDCPQTEISNGGEDEEGCDESSGDFDISDTDLFDFNFNWVTQSIWNPKKIFKNSSLFQMKGRMMRVVMRHQGISVILIYLILISIDAPSHSYHLSAKKKFFKNSYLFSVVKKLLLMLYLWTNLNNISLKTEMLHMSQHSVNLFLCRNQEYLRCWLTSCF